MYFTPYIDETGLHLPTYPDIRDYLLEQTRNIFGTDIYLGNDSQDYQQISVFSKMIYDTYLTAQMVYNNRTPLTALGVGLDALSPFFGVKRQEARHSMVDVTLTGEGGTVINNGVCMDSGDNKWLLPDSVTIPSSGQITVVATSEAVGAVYALPNTVTQIMTPIYGWTSVTNNAASILGRDVEADMDYRSRQLESTFTPSSAIFEGQLSSLKNVQGVTRVIGYENDTGQVVDGFPPHSVTFVVEGGNDTEIATDIYLKKTPGSYTNGDQAIDVVSIYGNTNTIRFYRPEYLGIYVKVQIKPLSTYYDNLATTIQDKLIEYLTSVDMGEIIYNSVLISVALGAIENLGAPSFTIVSLETSVDGETYSTSEIKLSFKQAATTDADKIQVSTAVSQEV